MVQKIGVSLLALIIFAFTFLATGCEPKNEEKLRISMNPWIGFTPFAYAEAKGWLKESNIELIWGVSLGENVALYATGRVHGFTATQYEAMQFRNNPNLKLKMLIDRSDGADTIHSNFSIEKLKNTDERLEAFFEINSVNEDLFGAFLQKHDISKEKFKIKHADQGKIASIPLGKSGVVLISYEPYASAIEKKGFRLIESTKTLQNIQIIDALFLDTQAASKKTKELLLLKKYFETAKKAFSENPKEYYETISGYLQGQSFEEFKKSAANIEWLENNNTKAIEMLKAQHIDTSGLES